MKQVADTYHLWKRGSAYYFRRKVPMHLVDKAGTPVVQYSLKTGDRREAQRRARIEDLRADHWFAELEAGTIVTVPGKSNVSAPRKISIDELVDHARQYVHDEDQRREKRLLAHPLVDRESLGNLLDDVVGEHDAVRLGDEVVIDRVASEIGKRAGVDDHAPTALLSIAVRALGELASRQGARLAGDYAHSHFDVMFAPRPDDAKPRTTVATLVDQYLTELREEHSRGGVASKTTEKHAVVLDYIREALGSDTVVATIDDDVVQKVRRMIARTPANRAKAYPKLSLADAIERGEKEKRPTLQHLTQRTYIEGLRNFLKFAVRKKLLASNPAEEARPMTKDPVPLDEKRLPFEPEQLQAFFHGAFYLSCLPDAAKPYVKKDKAWRYWLPLLALFTGARPNELCQLYVDDIRQTKAGTWFFDLKNEGKGQSRKNEASKRCVPVHPELVRLGFLDFADQRRKGAGKNGPRLFYELRHKPHEPTNFAWYACRRFNEVFLPDDIEVGERQSFYSFRHNVRDALRRAKVNDEALLALGGWTPAGGKPVSSDYGRIRNPDLWVEEVAAIAYPGVTFEHLYPAA